MPERTVPAATDLLPGWLLVASFAVPVAGVVDPGSTRVAMPWI